MPKGIYKHKKGKKASGFKGDKAITRKKYYCKEPGCNNEIHYSTWKCRGGKCHSCASKKDGRCFKTYYCIDCGKEISLFSALYGSGKCKFCCRKGKLHPMFGRINKWGNHNKKTKEKMSFERKGRKNPNWQGGISKLPYPFEFTEELKEKIRKRDNYQCQLCNLTNEEHLIIYDKSLPVHHIDYNKDNLNDDNLITLCKKCNSRVNFNRDYWYAYFTYLMEERNEKHTFNRKMVSIRKDIK